MTISVEDIARALDALLSGTMSREAMAGWAEDLRRKADAGLLECEPPSAKERIWEAILYLIGVDLKVSPTEYLHDRGDFIAFRQRRGL